MITPIPPPPGSVPVVYPTGAAVARHLVRDALAAHLAGKLAPMPWFATRMIEIQPEQMPLGLVYVLSEKKDSVSGNSGAFWFRTTVSVAVNAKVEAEDEPGVEAALDELDLALQESIFRVRDDDGWMQPHWSPDGVECRTSISAEGERMVGDLQLRFDVIVEGESFEPIITTTLNTIGIRLDAIDPFDRLGTYTGQPTAPPRTRGPDGRAETGANITLPNP